MSNRSQGFTVRDLSGGVAATGGMTKVFLMSRIKQSHPLPFVGWGEGMNDGGSQRTTELGFRQAGLGLRGAFSRRDSRGFSPLRKFSGI